MNRLDDLRLSTITRKAQFVSLGYPSWESGQIRARFAFSRVLLERRQLLHLKG